MGKKKKTRRSNQKAKGFGVNPSAINAGINRVTEYLSQGELNKALNELEILHENYPDHPEVLEILAAFYIKTNQPLLYQDTIERLAKIRPHDRLLLLNLGQTYKLNVFPRLALDVFRKVRKQFAQSGDAQEIETTIAELEKIVAQKAQELNIELDEQAYEMLRLYERCLCALRLQQYDKCRPDVEQLLELNPNFVPAWTKLSIIQLNQGDYAGAIATLKKVLELDPNHSYALSKMIYLQTIQGNSSEVERYYKHLKHRIETEHENTDPDFWLNVAEILSFLEDDQTLLEIYQKIEPNEQSYSLEGEFYHFVATAYLYLGNEKKAKQLWEKALEKNPQLSIAQENLDNLKYPKSFRNAAWAFNLAYWVFPHELETLMEATQKTSDSQKLSKVLQEQLTQNTLWKVIIPKMLRRGSEKVCSFAINFIEMCDDPDLLQALKEFALGTSSADSLRYQAAVIAAKKGVLPSGFIKMWLREEWQEELILGINILDHVEGGKYSQTVVNLLQKGTQAITDEDFEKGEKFLKEALNQEPDSNDIKFHLALSYQLQNRDKEGEKLLNEIHTNDPNYPFARLILAKKYIDDNQLEKANALLEPMLTWKDLSIQALSLLCQMNLELTLAQKDYKKVKSWFTFWKKTQPDHPAIGYWEEKLDELVIGNG